MFGEVYSASFTPRGVYGARPRPSRPRPPAPTAQAPISGPRRGRARCGRHAASARSRAIGDHPVDLPTIDSQIPPELDFGARRTSVPPGARRPSTRRSCPSWRWGLTKSARRRRPQERRSRSVGREPKKGGFKIAISRTGRAVFAQSGPANNDHGGPACGQLVIGQPRPVFWWHDGRP